MCHVSSLVTVLRTRSLALCSVDVSRGVSRPCAWLSGGGDRRGVRTLDYFLTRGATAEKSVVTMTTESGIKRKLCRDLPREKGEAFEVWNKELLDAGHGEGDEDASWSDTFLGQDPRVGVRDLYQRHIVAVGFKPTHLMPADIFTKALPEDAFKRFRATIMNAKNA